MPTQEQLDNLMARLGCERRTYGSARSGGGYWCPTHSEGWWFEGGINGCRRAFREVSA